MDRFSADTCKSTRNVKRGLISEIYLLIDDRASKWNCEIGWLTNGLITRVSVTLRKESERIFCLDLTSLDGRVESKQLYSKVQLHE